VVKHNKEGGFYGSMERVPTGIEGLDDLIEGGFPRRRMILVSGACGTGKTIFSAQFIYKGAVEYDEPGIYVTLDERPDLIREDMLQFGWDFKREEERDMIRIIDASIAKVGLPSDEVYHMPETGFDLDRLLVEIIKAAKEMGAKRVAVDSLPALGFRYDNESDIRKAILKMSYVLMKSGLTSIITSEIPEG
jgi:KaiC/GvpD/RAD55 family RecA-like ATPase